MTTRKTPEQTSKLEEYTIVQFLKAIPGTGGVITRIAKNLGCNWHLAKKYIEKYPTIKAAWYAEKTRINDTAKDNIVKAIEEGDLNMSKWWLQVMDDDFVPREKREIQNDSTVHLYIPENHRDQLVAEEEQDGD